MTGTSRLGICAMSVAQLPGAGSTTERVMVVEVRAPGSDGSSRARIYGGTESIQCVTLTGVRVGAALRLSFAPAPVLVTLESVALIDPEGVWPGLTWDEDIDFLFADYEGRVANGAEGSRTKAYLDSSAAIVLPCPSDASLDDGITVDVQVRLSVQPIEARLAMILSQQYETIQSGKAQIERDLHQLREYKKEFQRVMDLQFDEMFQVWKGYDRQLSATVMEHAQQVKPDMVETTRLLENVTSQLQNLDDRLGQMERNQSQTSHSFESLRSEIHRAAGRIFDVLMAHPLFRLRAKRMS